MISADLVISLCAIFILLVLAAFFSACETALTAASKERLHALEKEGNRRAAQVNRILEHKDRMMGAILLGNNLVNILGSALATSVLMSMFGPIGIFYATVIMTTLILIFTEVLPKTYAIHHADKLSMAIAPAAQAVIFILGPVTQLVTRIVGFTLKILRADLTKGAGDHVELLRGVIELHRGEEEETDTQRAMLRSILDLVDVEVDEIMTYRRNVQMIDVGQPVEKIVEDILDSPFSRLPIWRDNPDNIVGIVHVKALLRQLQAARGQIAHIDIEALASEPWFVPNTTILSEQLEAFRARREHFAIVVDEYGSFMGVVTLEDILEEIVGDIDDETDKIVAGVRRQANGTYVIDGTVTIRDLNRDFEWNFPADVGYSTLAGLILHESQMIPDVGRVFNFFGFTFEVMRRQRHQITLIRVTPPRKAD